MQDEDPELSNLSPETVQKAIDAVKARAWDINPFTVADELKISRSAVYRHAEIMKLIIAARGGGFGMDVQTSLDLTWQLRQLEQQNNELKEKLAISGSHRVNGLIKTAEEISDSLALHRDKEADKKEDIILNFANNGPPMSHYFNQFADMTWKDIETVYYFRVASLKDYAKSLSSIDGQAVFANGDSVESASDSNAISYGSLISVEAHRRQKQALSISPFARLKGGSLGMNHVEGVPGLDWGAKEKGQTFGKLLNQVGIEPLPVTSPSLCPIEKTKQERPDLPLECLTGDKPVIESAKPVDKFEAEMSQVVAELHMDLASKIRAGLVEISDEIVTPEMQIPSDSASANFGGWQSIESKKTPTESGGWQSIESKKTPSESGGWQSIESKKTPSESGGWQSIESKKTPSESGGWQSIESQKTPTETEGWIKFETQLQPLGGEPLFMETSVQTDLSQAKLSETEDKIQTDIKLIPLLKDKSAKPQSHAPSAKTQTDIGQMESIQAKIDSSIEEEPSGGRDELRDLIQSHIRNAAEQMAEFSHGYSIGSGKEFEVWLNNPARTKFVGSTKSSESSTPEEIDPKSQPKKATFKPRVVPSDVRKACLILGVRPDNITYEIVQESWKRAIAAPGVHPDLGGDTELAVYLNTAKDVLARFLDAQAPKLGKKFGPFKVEKDNKPKADKPKNEQ